MTTPLIAMIVSRPPVLIDSASERMPRRSTYSVELPVFWTANSELALATIEPADTTSGERGTVGWFVAAET